MDKYLGNSNDLFLPEGYSSLIQSYAAPIMDKVEIEAAVTKINYKKSTVKVIYNKGGSTANTILKTKKVILTVPLGVLKAESIKFLPKLPLRTRRSISKIGMGRMNKIFMFWNPDDVFWPSNIETFGDVKERNVDLQFFNPSTYNDGKPMLFAFFAGDDVESIESNQSNFESEVQDIAMSALRNMFGNTIPDPEQVVVTRWNEDKYTKGSYSFNQLGMSKTERKKLAKPIKQNRIFISGEATNFRYFQTTHGAYWAGKSAAQKVSNALKSSSDEGN